MSEATLLLTPHQASHGNPALTASTDASSSVSSSTTTTSTNSTNTDRATLFTSSTHAPFPNHSLPTFFGTSLNIARRSNLVFRNGAYGIPKARPTDDKGKEKAVVQAEEAADELELALSVSVGEDAVRADLTRYSEGRTLIPQPFHSIFCAQTRSAWRMASVAGLDMQARILHDGHGSSCIVSWPALTCRIQQS